MKNSSYDRRIRRVALLAMVMLLAVCLSVVGQSEDWQTILPYEAGDSSYNGPDKTGDYGESGDGNNGDLVTDSQASPESDRDGQKPSTPKRFENDSDVNRVKASDLPLEMPTWFINASAEQLNPRSLLNGTFEESTYATLIKSLEDRRDHVTGAATDGATRVWVVVECPGPGKLTYRLERAEDGAFSRPEIFDNRSRTVEVELYEDAGSKRHFGFVLYIVPDAYGPPQTSPREHHRTIPVNLRWEADWAQLPNAEPREQQETFTLVRPPVILQHGICDNPDDCWRQFPQETLSVGDYPRGHKAMYEVLIDEGFLLPNGKPAVFTVGYENDRVDVSRRGKYTSSGLQRYERTVRVNGVDVGSSSFVNLAHVLWENPGGIRDALAAYREAGIAATRADVICHGMGGLVARLYIRGAHLYERGDPQRFYEFPDPSMPIDRTVWYYRANNFMQGDVHRLITVCTAHKGSDAPGRMLRYASLDESEGTTGVIGPRVGASIPIIGGRAERADPDDIGPVGRSMGQERDLVAAFHDQQPNSAALHAIGATPVPAHAIAGVCLDEDLDSFEGSYRARSGKMHLLTSKDIIERAGSSSVHGDASFKTLQASGVEEDAPRPTKTAAAYSDLGVIGQADDLVDGTTHNTLGMFRSVVFGNTANDGAVRLESALGGLQPDVDASVIDHVLHGSATSHPEVQTRVLELLRGGFEEFSVGGFPRAGGVTRGMPRPGENYRPPASRIAIEDKRRSGAETHAEAEPAFTVHVLGSDYTNVHDDGRQARRREGQEAAERVYPGDGRAPYEQGASNAISQKAPDLPDRAHWAAARQLAEGTEGDFNTGLAAEPLRESFDGDIAPLELGLQLDTATAGRPVDFPQGLFDDENASIGNGDRVDASSDSQINDSPSGPIDLETIHLKEGTPIEVTSGSRWVDFADWSFDEANGRIDKGILIRTARDKQIVDYPDGPIDHDIPPLDESLAIDVTPDSRTIGTPLGPFAHEGISSFNEQPWTEAPIDNEQLWTEAPTEGPPQALRTLVYHQLFDNDADRLDRAAIHGQPVLSADGTRAVFCGKGVYVIDHDGTHLRRVGEAEASVAYAADISPDGQWVAFYDNLRVYAARADGSGPGKLLESSYGAFYGLRICGNPATLFLVCAKPAEVRTSPEAPWESFGNGIWAIDPNTGSRRHLVDFELMAEAIGAPKYSTLSVANQGEFVFDVSEDGRHLVFTLHAKTDGSSRTYGWSAEEGTRELVRVEDNMIGSLAISGDGNTVALVTRGSDGGLFAIGFDGSNFREVLKAKDAPARFTDHPSYTRLSYDGSFFLHGRDNLLVRLSDGLARNLGPSWDSSINTVFDVGMYRLAMNRDATRFVFISRQASGRMTLTSLTANPGDVGQAPRITDVRLDPFELVAEEPGPKLSARVSTDLRITHARTRIFARGRLDKDVSYRDMRDDGRGGDTKAADGIYTFDNLLPRSDRKDWNGSRVIRVFIQGYDDLGLAHATAVDYGPWPIAP